MEYDLIVIGAGPGGYVAAIHGAKLGKKIAVIENREVGGTCLNRGCIPTKTLTHATGLFRQMNFSAEFGIYSDNPTYSIEEMFLRKQKVVDQLKSGIEGLFQKHKIDFIQGTGKIIEKNKVLVGDTVYHGEKLLVATGSRPSRPPIPGLSLPGVVTSDELLEEGHTYKSLTIIGGGVIGAEFAGIYNDLGCQVTILEARERILPTMDRDISQSLAMVFKKRGIQIVTGAMVEGVEQAEEGLLCRYSVKGESKSVTSEGVLVCIGRTGNIEDLWEETMSIETERNLIITDENFQTTEPDIYAIGDIVKGGIQLAHVASAQGVNAVCAMFNQKTVYDLNVVPSCVYTSPEIASVGITSEEGKEKGIPLITGKASTLANGKSILSSSDRGYAKLLFHKDTKVLMGAQLMCDHATDMIAGLGQAIVNGLTREELAAVIYPHPTVSEIIGEAIENAG